MLNIYNNLSDKYAKAANVLERAKEKIESALHSERTQHEKHNGIDENTPLNDVKAPNMFDRVKEEIEALVDTIHHKQESQHDEKRDESTKDESNAENSEKELMLPNLIEKAKEKIEAIRHPHNKETHGRREDINESTPIDEVKGPNVFERAKEELEAVVETIHHKKEPIKTKEEKGFWCAIGKLLEKLCSPKRD
ncbi:DEAD-box ATP-dependent RNA helicase [Melia azedarach]|uniref:DEAD-box ATP-dependent RNA helicase n=1 Tax=Melia azedarach TaxID=155640 RepID=A0ACC1XEG9_MELAZ|nr:DEAD-box ATP-dependent RNA helicase [Melia azedarach]